MISPRRGRSTRGLKGVRRERGADGLLSFPARSTAVTVYDVARAGGGARCPRSDVSGRRDLADALARTARHLPVDAIGREVGLGRRAPRDLDAVGDRPGRRRRWAAPGATMSLTDTQASFGRVRSRPPAPSRRPSAHDVAPAAGPARPSGPRSAFVVNGLGPERPRRRLPPDRCGGRARKPRAGGLGVGEGTATVRRRRGQPARGGARRRPGARRGHGRRGRRRARRRARRPERALRRATPERRRARRGRSRGLGTAGRPSSARPLALELGHEVVRARAAAPAPTRVTTDVSVETLSAASARAATRTVVPGAGSGVVSARLSPGAARRSRPAASFSKSPGRVRAQQLDLQHAQPHAAGGGARRHVGDLELAARAGPARGP